MRLCCAAWPQLVACLEDAVYSPLRKACKPQLGAVPIGASRLLLVVVSPCCVHVCCAGHRRVRTKAKGRPALFCTVLCSFASALPHMHLFSVMGTASPSGVLCCRLSSPVRADTRTMPITRGQFWIQRTCKHRYVCVCVDACVVIWWWWWWWRWMQWGVSCCEVLMSHTAGDDVPHCGCARSHTHTQASTSRALCLLSRDDSSATAALMAVAA